MGTWTLDRVKLVENKKLDTEDYFGTSLKVEYRLRYLSTGLADPFDELPRLRWHEVITSKDHSTKTYWTFQTNMYEHNPLSRTLEVWAKRYPVAYMAAGKVGPTCKGSSILMTPRGSPVRLDALGPGLKGSKQAEAVRTYLQTNGGGLEITIHDIPSLRLTNATATRVERLLEFDCSVVGETAPKSRYVGNQYLDVDYTKKQKEWKREFPSKKIALDLNGFMKVDPPPDVSEATDPIFVGGEGW
jgi:hypothetical protein